MVHSIISTVIPQKTTASHTLVLALLELSTDPLAS